MSIVSIITLIITIVLVVISILIYVLHFKFRKDTKENQIQNNNTNDTQSGQIDTHKKLIDTHTNHIDIHKKHLDTHKNHIKANTVALNIVNSKTKKNEDKANLLDEKINDLSNSTNSQISGLNQSIEANDQRITDIDSKFLEKVTSLNNNLTNMQGSATFDNLKLNEGGVFNIGNKTLRDYVVTIIDEQLGGDTETFLEQFTEHMTQAPAAITLVKKTDDNTSGINTLKEEVGIMKQKVIKNDNNVSEISTLKREVGNMKQKVEQNDTTQEVNNLKQGYSKIPVIENDIKHLSNSIENNKQDINQALQNFQKQYNITINRFLDVVAKEKAIPLALENRKDIEELEKKAKSALSDLIKFKRELQKGFSTNNLVVNGGTHDAIKRPDGTTKISSHGIMFGGANNKREINSAQISAGIHVPDSLNIVGMSDKKGNNRRIDMWAGGGLNIHGKTSITGDTNVNGKLIAANGVELNAKVQDNNPMISKTFRKGHSYGLSYGRYGQVHVHAGKDHPPSAVHLSFKDASNGYTSVLTARKDKVVINGDVELQAKDGPMITRTWDKGHSYGLSQEKDGNLHLYAGKSKDLSAVHLSFKDKNNGYTSVLTAKKDKVEINGDTNINGKVTTHNGVSVTKGDPGPLIEKRYGNAADRYGISQENNGTVHLYAANAYGPSTVNLSYATGEGTYKPVLTARKDNKVQINGQLCIGNTCINETQLGKMISEEDKRRIKRENEEKERKRQEEERIKKENEEKERKKQEEARAREAAARAARAREKAERARLAAARAAAARAAAARAAAAWPKKGRIEDTSEDGMPKSWFGAYHGFAVYPQNNHFTVGKCSRVGNTWIRVYRMWGRRHYGKDVIMYKPLPGRTLLKSYRNEQVWKPYSCNHF